MLVLAPTGRDGPLIAEMLSRAGLNADACMELDELSALIREGAGVALMAEESLRARGVRKLLEALRDQPAWSDLPVLLLSLGNRKGSEPIARLMHTFGEQANITILERPVRVPTLLSAVRSGLRARRRQYETREFLAERRRHEEKLREASKLESIGVLAGGIAHDYNNLLTGILGNASLALDVLPILHPVRHMLSEVVRASERAAELTRQVLAYAGKSVFFAQPVNVTGLVREIAGLIERSIARTVQLRLELVEVPYVEADVAQLQQVVLNLVINGAEAIGEQPGTVTVRTGNVQIEGENDPGSYVFLEVQDTGSGMDEATRQRIFDPFFSTKFTGRGLGLSAVLGIVRGHKGHVSVESTVGRGSTFRVALPASQECGRGAAAESAGD